MPADQLERRMLKEGRQPDAGLLDEGAGAEKGSSMVLKTLPQPDAGLLDEV